MTAIVTNLNEYRLKKATSVLREWSDDKLRSRYAVLKEIENGATYLTDATNPLIARLFPNGFDPDKHPTENIKAVLSEADRRGVTLT